VNQTGSDNHTAVWCAVQRGHEAVVCCLAKECGADVNRADSSGFTPLLAAANSVFVAVVRCLMK
jgi:ankyrin repeat protein